MNVVEEYLFLQTQPHDNTSDTQSIPPQFLACAPTLSDLASLGRSIFTILCFYLPPELLGMHPHSVRGIHSTFELG